MPGDVIAPLATLAFVGLLGAFDDYLNAKTGEGIRARQKLIWQTVVALRRRVADPADLRDHGLRRPVHRRRHHRARPYILFAAFAIVAAANGVNLTDGLDGLAGGTLASPSCRT
jgi:phospho-N-acetylmuramoyl-pentapeptide-transferase